MRRLMIAAILAGLVCVPAAQAQDKKPGQNAATKIPQAQIDKMRNCRTTAEKKQLKGEARKDFVRNCIYDGKPPPKVALPKQSVHPTSGHCKRQAAAKELKGKERAKFIKDCLKS